MDRTERLLIEWECAQNTLRFYNRLDAMRGAEAAELFTEDAVWYREGDDQGYTGRSEIAAHVEAVRERGTPGVDISRRRVFHLVTNLEVNVIDGEHAEVRALTNIVPGIASEKPGEPGTMRGITAIFPTVEEYRKTPQGWRIASKRTSRAFRLAE